MAQRKMAQEPPQTIGATGLVHEVFLRLQKEPDGECDWQNRAKFFSAAAEAMRRVLIDRARARKRQKRGGELNRTELALTQIAAPAPDDQILSIHDALSKLEGIDPRGAELVKMKYFVGMDWAEIAEVYEISPRTLRREWAYARAWLRDHILSDPGQPA